MCCQRKLTFLVLISCWTVITHCHGDDHDHDHHHSHRDDLEDTGNKNKSSESDRQLLLPRIQSLLDMEALTYFALHRHPDLIGLMNVTIVDSLTQLISRDLEASNSSENCSQLSDKLIETRRSSSDRANLLNLCESLGHCHEAKDLELMVTANNVQNVTATEAITILAPLLLFRPSNCQLGHNSRQPITSARRQDVEGHHDHHDHHNHEDYPHEHHERHGHGPSHRPGERPATFQVWLYAILFVSIISLGSLIGVALIPCLHQNYFDNVLVSCEGLAIGSLTASALFHLIPHAFHIHDEGFIWKSLMIFAGLYLFHLAQSIGLLVSSYKKGEDGPREQYKVTNGAAVTTVTTGSSSGALDSNSNTNSCSSFHGHSHGSAMSSKTGHVATVAYLVIFGDGLHNFIDGLSIGAAFAESIVAGVSVSIAVICEELPHELGDFAVLLSSGMSWRRAIIFNLLSASTAYAGMAMGIVLSNWSALAGDHIRAVAAGMFLYIALVGLMSKMTAALHLETKFNVLMTKFALQNLGIVTGVTLLLLFAIFEDKISAIGGMAHSH